MYQNKTAKQNNAAHPSNRKRRHRRQGTNFNNHPQENQPSNFPQKVPADRKLNYTGVFASLLPNIQHALVDEHYDIPTPIQEQSIPPLLTGSDIMGCAQTGTGKTAAFVLPLLQFIQLNPKKTEARKPRALILAPTRELAAQINDSIKTYGRYLPFKHNVIFGGVGQNPQVNALRNGVDITVATPGRLLDLINQGHASLSQVEIFVLDEADRMLDMGFLPDIRRIIAKLPEKRQSLFFSATMSPKIVKLANTMINHPVQITIEPDKPTLTQIDQKMMFLEKKDKDALLGDLLNKANINKVIVFVKMKHSANKVVRKLSHQGINAAAIHGNKSQSARTKALHEFRSGKIRVLVATDIAARGIDVDGISHVFNYDLPNESETYIHRIGRTARAGKAGTAISFCSPEERDCLRDIERLLRKPIKVDLEHRYHSDAAQNAKGADARPPARRQGQARRSPSRNHPRRPRSYSR